jgi:hypothetical protein
MRTLRLLLAELLTCLARMCVTGLEEASEPSPASRQELAKRSATDYLHRCYLIDSPDHLP